MNRSGTPLYRQIKDRILQYTLELDIRAGDKLPTETEMAALFYTSRSAVKRAMSLLVDEQLVERQIGSGTYVLPKLVELRRERLAQKRPWRIALVVPEITDRYSRELLWGICREIEANGDDLELYNTFNKAEKETRILKRLASSPVDGVILRPATCALNNRLLEELICQDYPLVLVDYALPKLNCHCVMSDHTASGYQAARYLLDRGHRRIGFVETGESMVPSQQDRLNGYRLAMEESGQPPSAADIFFLSSVHAAFKSSLRLFFENNPELTGVLCGHCASPEILKVLSALGRRVPEEVSLVCFDGLEDPEYVAYPLTYIHQSEREIGREAVRLLHRLFANPRMERQVMSFPVELFEGDTVKDIS